MSEYVGEHWKARTWIAGFTGSAGTAVIARDDAGLWTDGRYFIQAARQLEGSGVRLFRMGEKDVPTVEEVARADASAWRLPRGRRQDAVRQRLQGPGGRTGGPVSRGPHRYRSGGRGLGQPSGYLRGSSVPARRRLRRQDPRREAGGHPRSHGESAAPIISWFLRWTKSSGSIISAAATCRTIPM